MNAVHACACSYPNLYVAAALTIVIQESRQKQNVCQNACRVLCFSKSDA